MASTNSEDNGDFLNRIFNGLTLEEEKKWEVNAQAFLYNTGNLSSFRLKYNDANIREQINSANQIKHSQILFDKKKTFVSGMRGLNPISVSQNSVVVPQDDPQDFPDNNIVDDQSDGAADDDLLKSFEIKRKKDPNVPISSQKDMSGDNGNFFSASKSNLFPLPPGNSGQKKNDSNSKGNLNNPFDFKDKNLKDKILGPSFSQNPQKSSGMNSNSKGNLAHPKKRDVASQTAAKYTLKKSFFPDPGDKTYDSKTIPELQDRIYNKVDIILRQPNMKINDTDKLPSIRHYNVSVDKTDSEKCISEYKIITKIFEDVDCPYDITFCLPSAVHKTPDIFKARRFFWLNFMYRDDSLEEDLTEIFGNYKENDYYKIIDNKVGNKKKQGKGKKILPGSTETLFFSEKTEIKKQYPDSDLFLSFIIKEMININSPYISLQRYFKDCYNDLSKRFGFMSSNYFEILCDAQILISGTVPAYHNYIEGHQILSQFKEDKILSIYFILKFLYFYKKYAPDNKDLIDKISFENDSQPKDYLIIYSSCFTLVADMFFPGAFSTEICNYLRNLKILYLFGDQLYTYCLINFDKIKKKN